MSTKQPFCRADKYERMLIFQIGPKTRDVVSFRVSRTGRRPSVEEIADTITKAAEERELVAANAAL